MFGRGRRIEAKLDAILALLHHEVQMDQQIQAALDADTASIAANTSAVGSATQLLQTLSSKLGAIAALDPTAIAAAVSNLKAGIDANTTALASAVVQNTPAAS